MVMADQAVSPKYTIFFSRYVLLSHVVFGIEQEQTLNLIKFLKSIEISGSLLSGPYLWDDQVEKRLRWRNIWRKLRG